MNIGDRVRLLRSKEEGIIRKFINEKTIEVEIEDGFSLPVLRSEIVVVAAEESIIFKNAPKVQAKNAVTPQSGVFADKGIFMAFVQINDQRLSLHFINNTEFDLSFALFQEEGNNNTGLQAGLLKARSEVKIQDVSIQNFEKWGAYLIQVLYFKAGYIAVKEPFVRKIRFRANTFFKNKAQAPILGGDAFVFQLDSDNVKIEPKEIIEKMFGEEKQGSEIVQEKKGVVSREVDLHIEQLSNNFSKLSNAEILNIQLETFEKQLDNAIVAGLPEITFIHGVGNGILKNEIHKRLSKNKQIAFFQDARKEKFGYGATFVKLK
jgi:hypothetical protein